MSNFSDYWTAIEETAGRLMLAQPTTSAGVAAILAESDPSDPSMRDGRAAAFWSGANAGRSLDGLLMAAGWRYEWAEASYFWQMRHPESGDVIAYIEGDVYDTAMPNPDA